MILLDTSALVEALGAGGRLRETLRYVIAEGERMAIPSLVLYEWLRGPRLPEELEAEEIEPDPDIDTAKIDAQLDNLEHASDPERGEDPEPDPAQPKHVKWPKTDEEIQKTLTAFQGLVLPYPLEDTPI